MFIYSNKLKAPFVRTPMSEHQYVEDATNHTRGIFRVLNVPDIARAVLKDLAETGYLDLSNLSRTCHTGLNIVSQYIEHWDETPPGDFLGEDISLDAHDKVQRTPVTLLISPVRQAFKDGKRPDISYAEHYKTQGNLCKSTYLVYFDTRSALTHPKKITDRALKNRADYITNLQMHRIQFLDLNAVGCILKSLRNLKLIGIYQCQLLHLGNMAELLDVVKARGQRTGGDSSYVDLDFFPMYHEGPNSIIRHGSYGAVWNHPTCDMATGIWQLVLYELYPKARYLDIDILSWGRAFRHFLEKLPMPSWTNVRIYEAIKSIEYRGKENPGELVMTAYNKSEGKWERFADDVTAALRGDNVEPAVVPGHQLNKVVAGYQPERHRKYGWWRDTKRCATCGINVLAVFCPFGDNHCWGCQAKEYLTGQYDHYLSFKSLAAATWFGRCRNLNDVVKTGFYEKGYQIAQELDIFRRRDMTNDHGTGKADWADHADFGRLHRRYAREYEPHGPIDRKLNDKQYMPVGHFPTAITSSMVPACYPEFKLAIWMRDWEIERKKSHPQESAAMRARNRQEELKKQTKRMQNSRENIIQDRNRQDARLIEDEREHYNRRRQWPNRQIKCWDELIQDMFFRSNTIGKDGKPLTMPRWIIEKRPYGPLGVPST